MFTQRVAARLNQYSGIHASSPSITDNKLTFTLIIDGANVSKQVREEAEAKGNVGFAASRFQDLIAAGMMSPSENSMRGGAIERPKNKKSKNAGLFQKIKESQAPYYRFEVTLSPQPGKTLEDICRALLEKQGEIA